MNLSDARSDQSLFCERSKSWLPEIFRALNEIDLHSRTSNGNSKLRAVNLRPWLLADVFNVL